MATKLTKNFTLEELTSSVTASNWKIDNTPNAIEEEKLRRLAVEVLQPIRDKYKHPITITSGFRNQRVNQMVGGSKTSQHMKGEAADIQCTATSKAYLFNLIRKMIENKEIEVGQLIWEYGSKKEPNWIHVSLPYTKKNQILYFYSK